MREYDICKVCSGNLDEINSKFHLVKCRNCKLVFCKKIFSQEEFINTYNTLYNKSSQYSTHLNEFKNLKQNKRIRIGKVKMKVLRFIKKKKTKRLAEIGAGVGLIARFFQNNQIEYQGLELDKTTVSRAQSLGLPISCGDFTLLNEFENDYDAIVAFEVIEHLQDLHALFLMLKSKLKENGYFGFTVPNYDKRLNFKRPEDRIYQSAPPIHLNFFTTESIELIAAFYGFRVVFCKEKRFPFLLWKRKETYINLLKGILGQFHGPSIYAVIQKS